MVKANIYLSFDGNAEEAFGVYAKIFQTEFDFIQRFKEIPDMKVPKDEEDKIMHISMKLGNDILMGCDTPQFMNSPWVKGNNISISLHPESKEETTRIFEALSDNGNVIMPLADTFWNAYYGMCEDRFGVRWMVNYSYE